MNEKIYEYSFPIVAMTMTSLDYFVRWLLA